MSYQNPIIAIIISVLLLSGCTSSKKTSYNPDKKFSVQELQEDFNLLRKILEKKHPSLYWYTPKDSMDRYFDKAYSNISDSMTELRFAWNILSPITHVIRCGHTSVEMSKGWNKYMKHRQIPSFPLFIKSCKDTFVVIGNLNREDSILKPGTIITSINGFQNKQTIKYIFNCLPLDGYADNVNYIRISSNFPYLHRNVFGLYKKYEVGYIDSFGVNKITTIPMYTPLNISNKKIKIIPTVKRSRKIQKEKLRENYRSLKFETNLNTATLTLNTFSRGKGKHLRSFLRKSFKKIEANKINNLILDIRGNGGGDVGMYILLTKYLRMKPFKVADTAYSISKSLAPYGSFITDRFINNIGLFFLTKKRKDGNYHFGYWERHSFKPKINHHFNGQLYVLINGLTFSASTLFCNAIKGQSNVKLVGEETGGGWYGNSGIMIPDIILPNTKLKVRLPLFKIVQYNHIETKGTGVIPDIYIPQTVDAVKNGIDLKMETVKEMISNSSKK